MWITRAMSLMMDGWMPSVGSSRMMSLGSATSARAIASCCCCPPDRSPPRRDSMLFSTGKSSNTSSLMRRARDAGRVAMPIRMFSSTVNRAKMSRPCGT
ncbi:hypothetical protein G6F35_011906 [Rhizopus arrhizus]|nr:hypothetical protein G6F35_011906 [Rhizopus arrhizus]